MLVEAAQGVDPTIRARNLWAISAIPFSVIGLLYRTTYLIHNLIQYATDVSYFITASRLILLSELAFLPELIFLFRERVQNAKFFINNFFFCIGVQNAKFLRIKLLLCKGVQYDPFVLLGG